MVLVGHDLYSNEYLLLVYKGLCTGIRRMQIPDSKYILIPGTEYSVLYAVYILISCTLRLL